MASQQGKGKAKDARPARVRYWATRKLETNKVRNIMRSSGVDEKTAKKQWNAARGCRRTTWLGKQVSGD